MGTRRAATRPLIVFACLLELLLSASRDSSACDTWVALGDVTTCGYTILGKNSDRPRFDCQPLVFHPRQKWAAGLQIDLARISIDQVPQTHATLGSSPYWSWGYEEGINEHGVAIGNEAIWTKVLTAEIASHQAGKGPKLGPTGMDLVRLGLERGTTARESLAAIAQVIEKYGQFGSASPTRGLGGAYHNSFILADPKEAWILETAGSHWVAKRVANGATSISNGVSLGSDFDLASAHAVQHAVSQGWWPQDKIDEFHFQHAYSKDTSPGQAVVTRVHSRATCSRRLLQDKGHAVDPRWMMHIARSPRINLNATASSSVAILPNTEDQLPVYWWCPAVPSCSCYIPFFVHGNGPPSIVSTAGTRGSQIERPSQVGQDEFSPESYWWLFRDLSDQVMARRSEREPIVREVFDSLEKEFEAGIPSLIDRAVQLRKEGQTKAAAELLDEYTAQCLARILPKVSELRTRFARSGGD